jgi:Protein of unknown function (DUF3592)
MDPRLLAFLVGGVVFCAAAWIWFRKQKQFIARAQTAQGSVVRLANRNASDGGSTSYAPVVQFKAASGQAVEFTDEVASRPASYDVGETVSVLYAPGNPQDARVAGFTSSYLGPTIVMVMGLGFVTLAGIGIGVVDVVSNAIAPGRTSVGKFAGVWVNEDAQTSGITRVEIRQRWPGSEMKVWGKCQTTDCDWGLPHSYNLSAVARGEMKLGWKPGFAVITQELKLLPDGRLEVVSHRFFPAGSGRRPYDSKEIFRKVGPP